MKTQELIGALVADHAPSRFRFARIFALSLAAAAVAAAVAFFAFIGVRPDLGAAAQHLRFLTKLAVTLTLLAAGVGLLRRLAVPGADVGYWRFAPLVALAVLIVAVALELLAAPSDSWGARLVGVNARFCLIFIPAIAIGPLAILLIALRRGAPSRPAVAGAVAGLVAGALAASFYAAHCQDDSPLFVAVWYSLAIGLVTLAGSALGARLLRW
ncbi:NrsF family protein [Methylosinus sp. Ce-a6]|uniref:NrsF family protein n=1 Tax=Methylosinus sp. Ce-a6 TaxID=2172005 RepID=UPI001359FFBD|nr:NrsF family protein [Methylosinus sp. Ce-a6]